jgi:hypothetical protein
LLSEKIENRSGPRDAAVPRSGEKNWNSQPNIRLRRVPWRKGYPRGRNLDSLGYDL